MPMWLRGVPLVQITAVSDSSVREQVGTALAPYFTCVAQKAAQTTLAGFPHPSLKVPGVSPGKEWGVKNPKVEREGNYTTLKGDVEVK